MKRGKKLLNSKRSVRVPSSGFRTKLLNSKRSLSPIIATVLLIVLVIIIAMLIFLWVRSIIGEACEKNSASCEQRCGEVSIEASYSGTTLYLNNNGNVPVQKASVKMTEAGRESVSIIEINLSPGSASEKEVTGIDTAEKVVVVPIVLGQTKNSKTEYTCKNNGVEALKT